VFVPEREGEMLGTNMLRTRSGEQEVLV